MAALSGQELSRQVEPSVFRLSVQLKNGQSASGTGFVISETGLVVTNNHVIEGAVEVQAEQNGLVIPMKRGFYARDSDHDLALLQMDLERAPKDYKPKPVEVAPSTLDLDRGVEVYVLGHPEGVRHAELNRGYITAIESDPEKRRLRFDASIHGGSSGSPLFHSVDANVIGVVTSYYTEASKLAYATPIEYLHKLQELAGPNPTLKNFSVATAYSGSDGPNIIINLILSFVFFFIAFFGVRRLMRLSE